MVEDAADEGIGERREAESARVRFLVKQVAAVGGGGEMIVHVRARSGPGRKWFGHEGRDRAVPLGKLPGHHAEERETIGGLERGCILEVDLVLKVGVLVIGLVDAPSESFEGVIELAEEAERPGDPFVVVACLGEAVDLVRVPAADRAVRVPDDEEELGLDADVEAIALGPGLVEYALEVGARAERVGPTVDVEVGREPSHAALERQGGVSIEVRSGEHVVRMRALPHAPDRTPGEAGAGLGDGPQSGRGHELDLGRAVDVDKLDQKILNPVVFETMLERDESASWLDIRGCVLSSSTAGLPRGAASLRRTFGRKSTIVGDTGIPSQ